ncbi:MAG: DUF309 domain-containing protein [Chloroflexi bacterium]|nr:DUF309 domain-containing protein [Chloroflexota bacterium]
MAQTPYRDVEIPSEEELAEACQGDLHPMAIEGMRLFDAGDFWHAHEALEEAWLAEEGPARILYIGILQAGVTYLQIERKNFVGAAKMFERSKRYLEPLPDACRGVNVEQLRHDLVEAMHAAGRLGPERLDQFDTNLFKPLVRN